MAAIRTVRDAVLKILDGGTQEMTVQFDGEIRYEIRPNPIPVSHRGILSSATKGPELPVRVSFIILYRVLSWTTSPISVHDAILGINAASSWVTSLTEGNYYTCKLELTINDPDGVGEEIITFAKFAVTSIQFRESADGNRLYLEGLDMEPRPTTSWIAT